MSKLGHFYLALVLILGLATLLRFWDLANVPPALNWDEAAIVWNAKAIFTTRLDEYGTHLPLAFRSFGDYKAPAYIYLSAPFVGFLGATEFSARLLSALSGIASVGVIFLLVRNLFEREKWKNEVAVIASLMMAITPWHIILSRQASEANLALFLTLSGVWCFLLGAKRSGFWLLVACGFFTLSVYAYHSPKIFTPLLMLVLLAIFRRQIINKRKLLWLLTAGFLALLALRPVGYSILFDKGATRFQSTSIFFERNGGRRKFDTQLLWQLTRNYFTHFSPSFLFWGGETNPRIQLRHTGPLLLMEAPWLILGLLVILKKLKSGENKLLVSWLLLAPVPAAVGFEVPHPIRALALLPVVAIVMAIGLTVAISALYKQKIASILITGLFLVNLSLFLREYFRAYPTYAAVDWQYGYKEAATIARSYENQVEKVILTSHYGQPHIFMLVYQGRDPQQVLWGAMVKYLYRDLKWDEDSRMENVLLIGTPQEIPQNAPNQVAEIRYPNGEIVFRVVKTGKST